MDTQNIQQDYNAPPPRPIGIRVCKCGCGNEFQPKRRDQVYLNKQHADFGYNHGKRKKKTKNENELHKIQRINDRTLERHHKNSGKKEAVCFLNNLVADGFRKEFYIGFNKIDGVGFFYSYNYLFHIYQFEGQRLIKIRKK